MDVRSRFMRTEMLLGVAGMARLAGASVAVFGIGGVGSFTAEALARAGVGHLTLVDNDCVDVTNINRQIHACTDTIGMPKVEAMTVRIHGITPHCKVTGIQAFYLPENADDFLRSVMIMSWMRWIRCRQRLIWRAGAAHAVYRSSRAWGRRTNSIRHCSRYWTSTRRRWIRSHV